MSRTKRLTAFTQSYSQAAVVIPFVLVAPAYFANKIQLGALTADRGSVRQRAGRAVILRHVYRTMAEWRAVVARLDGFESSISERRKARGRSGLDPQRGHAQERDHPAAAPGQAAERRTAGRGRPFQPASRRTHARHRPVGRRQVDPVPRHRRHLAVRRGRDRGSRQRHPDDAAAAAVLPDRIAACGNRLSRRRRKLWRRQGQASPRGGRPAASSRRDWTKRRTGIACSRSANSSGWAWRARCCTRRATCSSMKPPPRSTSPRKRRCTPC